MAGSLVTEALSSDIACAIPANLALVFRIARPGGEMEPVVEDGRRPGELAVSCPGAVLHPGLAVLQGYVHRIVADHLLCRLLEVVRSEEHTSELQSRGHLVCRLLLENKNSIYTL